MSNKHNELIRSLRKQLEATERELADQKWLLERFLESPSWRMTYPVRWLAKQARAARAFIQRLAGKKSEPIATVSPTTTEEIEAQQTAEPESLSDVKQLFTEFYSVQLHGFLNSKAILNLPHSDEPEISIILVLYNRAEMTLACLRSLAEIPSERMEIIIVDNASQDQTGLLLDRIRGAHIIRNRENRNFLLGVNQAAEEAKGEFLLLLNNDAQVIPGTLRAALNTIRSAPDIGAVGGRVILLDGTLQEAGSIIWRDGSCLGYGRGDNPFAPMYMFRRDVDYCSGTFLLTPRSIWNELGGFDETFKPAYYEETDYCTRLWQHNLRVVYEPNSVLMHYEFASSDSVSQATELQRAHQQIFASRHKNLLSKQYRPDPNLILPARMKNQEKKRVLFIDDQAPHTWLGSGFPRSRTILLALLKQNCFVTFYPLSFFTEEWTSVYSDMPGEIEFMIGYGPPLLEAFLRNRRGYYNTIFISRPHNMKIVRRVLDGHQDWFRETNVVYDAEAIFATREVALQQLNGIRLAPEEMDALVQEEVNLATRADCVIAVSESDARQFRARGIKNVDVIGHALQTAPTPRGFDERSGFLFVGAIHEEATPNTDSVIWFLEEVLPKIQAQLGADVSFTMAGINKSERVRRLINKPSIRITGHLPDLTELYDSSRVFIAPTRYGAGIPHKVHEAATRGIPVVATPLLASQLGWEDGTSILVGTSADSFAQRCIQLYTDHVLWTQLRYAALDRVKAECSSETFEKNVAACFSPQVSRSAKR